MSIRRAPRPASNFYVLDKSISEDPRLSWGARGLLIFLLGKPDHWEVSVPALIKETADSGKPAKRDAVYGLLKELELAGYLTKANSRKEKGSFGGVDYIVRENPLTDNPEAVDPPLPDSPDTGQPDTANPQQVSIEGLASNETPARTDEKTSAGRQAKGCVTMPDEILLTDTHQRLASEAGVDLPAELEAFRDHHQSKGSKFKDWGLALNTWLRNAKRYGARRPATVHPISDGRARPKHHNLEATTEGLHLLADGTYSL